MGSPTRPTPRIRSTARPAAAERWCTSPGAAGAATPDGRPSASGPELGAQAPPRRVRERPPARARARGRLGPKRGGKDSAPPVWAVLEGVTRTGSTGSGVPCRATDHKTKEGLVIRTVARFAAVTATSVTMLALLPAAASANVTFHAGSIQYANKAQLQEDGTVLMTFTYQCVPGLACG